jgi:Domain of unknown function (DUF4190)/GYF domain 2
MSAIYKIIGEDGKEYGPATAEQIRQWVAEGRVEHRTPIFAEGAKDWNFTGLLPEFAGLFNAGTPSPIAPPKPAAFSAGQMPRTNSFATAGLIFGLLSVTCCCCGFPFGILGMVFSLIALSQIHANPDLQTGSGIAIAGLILSILSLLIGAGSVLFNLATSHPHIIWNAGRI